MRTLRWVVLMALVLGLVVAPTRPAAAHAEMVQASPRAGSTVGGEFHGIVLQFRGIAEEVTPQIELEGPPGADLHIAEVTVQGQRAVLPIHPPTVPGIYTVTWGALSDDGDGPVSGSFEFAFEPGAPEPLPITVDNVLITEKVGVVGWILLVVGAGLVGFLVHRVWYAIKLGRLETPERT